MITAPTYAHLERWSRWAVGGGERFACVVRRLGAPALAGPSALPGWSRAHLVAHVAGNASALRNLLHWAATGEVTPMYRDAEQRAGDIEALAARPRDELVEALESQQRGFAADAAELAERAWEHDVRTAQGRTIEAREVLWLRAREVWVHLVDLDVGVGFADLPRDLLAELIADVAWWRTGASSPALELHDDAGGRWAMAGPPGAVHGSTAALAAWLTGRDDGAALAARGTSLPALGPWL